MILYGVEIRGVKRGWEITDETQGRFSIKVKRTTGKQQSEQENETWYRE